MKDPFEPIGYSAGSPCCKCGTEIGSHTAGNPFRDKAVFVSKSGEIYCGDCAAKYNVGMFASMKKTLREYDKHKK